MTLALGARTWVGVLILVIGLVIETGCAERTAASITKDVADHFKPPSSVAKQPPPKFVAPKFTSTVAEAAFAQTAKTRVTDDEKAFAFEFDAKPWQDITQIVCNFYGYFAQPTNQLPTEKGFADLISFMIIKTFPASPSVRFREASNDLLAAIKAARKDQVDWAGFRNASIAAVCEIA